MNSKQTKPNTRTPGEVLAAVLSKHKITHSEAAKAMSVPVSRLSDIISGKRRITSDTALRLGVFLGNKYPARFWVLKQYFHDVHDVVPEEAGITSHVYSVGRPKTKSKGKS